MKKGDAVIIFPNVVHEYIESGDKDSESISIICVMDFITSLMRGLAWLRAGIPRLIPFADALKSITE